jgi:hypothetical protein
VFPRPHEESSTQQSLLDRSDHVLSVRLLLIEQSVAQGAPQSQLQLRGMKEPSTNGLEEVLRHIDHQDMIEPSCSEEFGLFTTGAHRSRSETHRPAVVTLRKPRGGKDGEVGGPTSRPQEPSTSSQHGELGRQSTKDICMNDGVEALGCKGKPPRTGNDRLRPLDDALNGGSLQRGSQSLLGYVRQDNRALGNLRQVQARPASTRSHIKQSVPLSQVQHPGDQVGLRQRRVAVRPEVSADDKPLELSRCIGSRPTVSLGECCSRILLVPGPFQSRLHPLVHPAPLVAELGRKDKTGDRRPSKHRHEGRRCANAPCLAGRSPVSEGA